MTFGEYLRRLREQQGLGIRELSRLSGLSLSHLQYLEKDAKRPGDATLKKLASHLGHSARELINARDTLRVETDLTLLLKEVGPVSAEERRRLLDIAKQVLGEESAKSQSSSKASRGRRGG